jgi:hypothetical protein
MPNSFLTVPQICNEPHGPDLNTAQALSEPPGRTIISNLPSFFRYLYCKVKYCGWKYIFAFIHFLCNWWKVSGTCDVQLYTSYIERKVYQRQQNILLYSCNGLYHHWKRKTSSLNYFPIGLVNSVCLKFPKELR